MGPPDFVGVGAQRSGTTWWHRLICDHPAVHAGPKELHFFDAFQDREFGEEDIAAYHRMFPRPPGSLVGEWTPRYLHDFWTPVLLRRAAPRARVLVLLRDPLERFRSGVAHRLPELRRALRGRRADRVRAMIAGEALSRSLYARQLTALQRHFERNQILVLQYERCIEDPAAELRHTYEFLGLASLDHVPSELTMVTGVPASKAALPPHVAESARAEIVRDARRLSDLAPRIRLDLWPSCRDLPDAG